MPATIPIAGLCPLPGTPGEGWVRVFFCAMHKDPHPSPLPAYREREKRGDCREWRTRLQRCAMSPLLAAETTANAAPVFYLTLLFIFVTAVVTTVVTKWAKDKCLKFFHGYHVTLERNRGQTIWGALKVFSSGVEIVHDHPYVDHRGRRKTSYMIYQQELEQQLLSILRYHDELDERSRRERKKQIHRT